MHYLKFIWKNISVFFTLIIVIAINPLVHTQTDSTTIHSEEAVDDLLQESTEELDNDQLYEVFDDLRRNPVNLNKATITDLQRIPLIDLATAKSIISYRDKYGTFFSVQELYSIKGLNDDLVKKIEPFVSITDQTTEVKEQNTNNFFQNSNLYFRNRTTNDLQTKKGFAENKYLGSTPKIYNRLLINSNNHFQLGLLTDKDAGEKYLDDFYSFHFEVKNYGILNSIVAGDYLVQFGQGLVLWSPYGFSKGAEAVYPIKKRDGGIKAYTSSTENNFFRGSAASLRIDKFTLSGFYSKNKFDANVDSVSHEISSMPVDGYHRTQNEIQKKKTANEAFYGGRLDYSINNLLNAGIIYYHSKFSNSIAGSDIYDLTGNEFNFTSFTYDIYINNINFFGEEAYDGNVVASINNIEFYITDKFTFITSIRNYPKNFKNIHAFGFGEKSGSTKNEFGIYNGFRWRSGIGIINAYYDQFKFPYATFDLPLPGEGNEFLININSKLMKDVETTFRYKYEKKDVAESISNSKQIVKRLKQSIRGELSFKAAKSIRLKERIEYNQYKINDVKVNESGFLIFQDIRFIPSANLNLYARIILFQTDSFNSAVYEFENDLTGVLTNLAMYEQGMRWYFILRYRPAKLVSLSLKYSESYKPDKKYLSSGNSQINGGLDNRISFQLDFNL